MLQFKCEIDPDMQKHLQRVLDGEYGIAFTADYKTILDIGANIGSFTFWASQVFPNATIYAYEPNAKNCTAFKQNLTDSGIDASRYQLTQAAVTSKPEKSVTLYQGSVNCGMHSLSKALAGQSVETFEALTVHPKDLPEVDFIKVDTEGCEVDILTAYLATGKRPSQISFEFHSVDDRFSLENIMFTNDYILTSAGIGYPSLGTMNFVHKRCFKQPKA